MDKKASKILHLLMLEKAIDRLLFENKFNRAKSSVAYRRTVADGKQEIEFHFRLPRFSDDRSIAHISPHIHLIFPEVISIYEKAVSGIESHVLSKNKFTLNQSIGVVGPERSAVDWRPKDENEYTEQIGGLIGKYLHAWVLPFLDEYTTAMSLVEGYESGDDRFPRSNEWKIMVASAAVATGKIDKGKEILEQAFKKKPGLLKTYQPVIDFFQKYSI